MSSEKEETPYSDGAAISWPEFINAYRYRRQLRELSTGDQLRLRTHVSPHPVNGKPIDEMSTYAADVLIDILMIIPDVKHSVVVFDYIAAGELEEGFCFIDDSGSILDPQSGKIVGYMVGGDDPAAQRPANWMDYHIPVL